MDLGLAGHQWSAYVETLAACGWPALEVQPAPDLPDSVFVEDAVVMFAGTAVITNPGADERRAETAGAVEAVRQLGYPTMAIRHGRLDGGDVLKVGETVYVGRGGRTDAAGVAELRALLAPIGFRVVAVPMTKALHLKSAVTALALAGRHRDRLPTRGRRPVVLPALPGHARGGWRARGRSGRGTAADGGLCPALGRAGRRPRLPPGGGVNQRVRDARGLCHLSVRAAARSSSASRVTARPFGGASIAVRLTTGASGNAADSAARIWSWSARLSGPATAAPAGQSETRATRSVLAASPAGRHSLQAQLAADRPGQLEAVVGPVRVEQDDQSTGLQLGVGAGRPLLPGEGVALVVTPALVTIVIRQEKHPRRESLVPEPQ